jgi:hypothetical protein
MSSPGAMRVTVHDPAQAQQLDQERGTVRACEQAGAALGCATWPEIGASFHLGLHPLARPAVQILGASLGLLASGFGHYSDINRLPRRYTQVMPHKMLF